MCPPTIVMNREKRYRQKNHFTYQSLNMYISAVKLGVLTWALMGSDFQVNI